MISNDKSDAMKLENKYVKVPKVRFTWRKMLVKDCKQKLRDNMIVINQQIRT